MNSVQVYLSIGSNLGDPLRNCCRGIELLRADRRVVLSARSPFYRSQPVDYLEQAWFVNAALQIRTALPPLELLALLQRIEQGMGREKSAVRFGPRVLDLDIVLYGDQVLQTPLLVVPHPRMHKRRFVLQPICDIDPSVMHPVLGQSVQALLKQLPTENQELIPCSSDC